MVTCPHCGKKDLRDPIEEEAELANPVTREEKLAVLSARIIRMDFDDAVMERCDQRLLPLVRAKAQAKVDVLTVRLWAARGKAADLRSGRIRKTLSWKIEAVKSGEVL